LYYRPVGGGGVNETTLLSTYRSTNNKICSNPHTDTHTHTHIYTHTHHTHTHTYTHTHHTHTTHTLRQTEMPALIDSWVRNSRSVKMLFLQKEMFLLILSKKKIHAYLYSIKDLSGFSSLTQNCPSVGKDTMLIHSRCIKVNKY